MCTHPYIKAVFLFQPLGSHHQPPAGDQTSAAAVAGGGEEEEEQEEKQEGVEGRTVSDRSWQFTAFHLKSSNRKSSQGRGKTKALRTLRIVMLAAHGLKSVPAACTDSIGKSIQRPLCREVGVPNSNRLAGPGASKTCPSQNHQQAKKAERLIFQTCSFYSRVSPTRCGKL